MNQEQNDRLLDETIRRAVGPETARFDAAEWMKKHREEVSILSSRKSHNKGGFAPKSKWRTPMNILKYAGGLGLAASVMVVAMLTLHSTTPSLTAAEALKQAATATSGFEGWIHVEGTVLKPVQTVTYDLNTKDDTVAMVTNIDGVREVTFLSPAKNEYLRYSSKTKAIEKNINNVEGAKTIASILKKQLLSPESLQQTLNERIKTEVTQGKEGDLDRFEITVHGQSPFKTLIVLADPKTKLIRRIDCLSSEGDKLGVMKMTYSETTEINSIYNLDVPRDAKIIEAQPTTAASAGGPVGEFAAILEQLKTKSYEFVMDIRDGNAGTTVKAAVLEPGKLRLEQTGDLGPIVSIVDNNAKRSLLLWERFKAANQFDKQEKEELGALGFLVLPGRSVSDLWSLQAGNEAKLGQKPIDGHAAKGFRVTQKSDDYTETITVWADAKTAAPLKVEVKWQSNKDDKQVLELTLRDFKVLQKPDPALFSTDVPAGYTLVNRQTLKQLAATPATATSAAQSTSDEAGKVLSAIELWHSGSKQRAVEALAAVDWKADIRFAREHYLFTMTESQYISLVSEDQQKVMAEIMPQSSDCRAAARELVDLARKARSSGKNTEAEKYLNAAAGLGHLLDRDKNAIIIVRMVGIAIRKLALGELSSLYEAQNETSKLQDTQRQIKELEEQTKEIKKSMAPST